MDQTLGGFLSKVGELIAEHAHNKLESNLNLSTLETLQKKLNSLVAKACDVEEQIKHAERSGKKKRKREVEEWLGEVNSIKTQVVELGTQVESQGFLKRWMNGREAEQLDEQVCKLLEQRSHFGELLIDTCGIRAEKMLIPKIAGEEFERNSERIWRLLESGEVLRIGVHGMGGVGKSTLVKGIYNRLRETYEHSVLWVTVSQEFTIKGLQDNIGRLLDIDFLGENNEDIRAGRVHRALSEIKNAILILDDVWKNIDLLKVGMGCPFSVECCRVIITTRSLEVCRQIGCQEVIAVHTLGEDEAWKLFHETFTLGKEVILDPKVEAIMKSVIKLCDGLPLGIITVAASMRGQTTIHAWRNALAELKKSFADQDGMREGEVFKVLKYSFDRLHANRESQSKDFNSLQLCFLYLSLYPEDRDVEKEQLVEEFISEGLLDTKKSRRAQFDQGHVILDKLLNVCLFEHSSFGGVKMHDLVRGMALKVCERKYMVRARDWSLKEIPKEEEWTEDLEKVSLFDCDIRRIEYGTSPNCPNLSTLLLRGNHLEFMPNSFFYKMQGLCTLDLRKTSITELPNSLSGLKSLKALLLKHCRRLEYVPYLGNMKALRELDLSHTAIKEVPQGVEELLNLRFLSMEGTRKLEVLPSGLLRKLGSLQHVRLPYHLEASIEEIVNLKEVEEFRGAVKSVGDFNCFIESYPVHDTFYLLQVGQLDYNILDEYPEDDDRELYNKVVILTRCNLADEKVSGQDIKLVEMKGCEGLSKCLLDDIINPTSLRKLKMWRCGGTEFILRLMSAQETSFQLSRLEVICLFGLDDFKGVIDTPTPTPPQCVFLSLKKLDINKCNKMRKLGLPVSGFPNLEDISIKWCHELEEIFEDEGRGESVILPKLRRLELTVLQKLESVFRRTMICNSIEEIRTQACQRLMNLGLPVWGFPNLEKIVISSCRKIKEIFEDEGMGESVTLPKLTSLYLISLPRLESVCRRTMICNSIKEIVIERCPRLMKKLPVHLDVPPPPTLITVEREWWESLEWDNPDLPHLLQPLLSFC